MGALEELERAMMEVARLEQQQGLVATRLEVGSRFVERLRELIPNVGAFGAPMHVGSWVPGTPMRGLEVRYNPTLQGDEWAPVYKARTL